MGVRGLSSFLKSHFPSAFVNLKHRYINIFLKLRDHVDELYFDLNGILHVLSRKHLMSHLSKNINLALEKIEQIHTTDRPLLIPNEHIQALSLVPLFEELYHSIFFITKKFEGTRRLFFTLDGIAPISKWELQEKRRLLYLGQKKNNLGLFGREALTPGTSLMFLIERTLLWVARDYLLNLTSASRNSIRTPFVVIDNPSRAGEAEWKTIQYLKNSINEQAQLLKSPPASISLTHLLTMQSDSLNIRRIICCSDADTMLMTLSYPLKSLFTTDVNLFGRPNILFSPYLLTMELAKIDPKNYLELRDSLLLLSLICNGSDYVSKVSGMPSIHKSWNLFLSWIKEKSNWKFINREDRSINLLPLIEFLKFCFSQSNSISLEDDRIDSNDNEGFPQVECEKCSISSYFAVLALNLDILFTGVCRFFFNKKVAPPSLEELISWSYDKNVMFTLPNTSPSRDCLLPSAYAYLLVPQDKHSCLAKPFQSIYGGDSNNDDLDLINNSAAKPPPRFQDLERIGKWMATCQLSQMEQSFSYSAEFPSIIFCQKIGGGVIDHEKFSNLFFINNQDPTCHFEVIGHQPYGTTSFTGSNMLKYDLGSITPLYQSNDPFIGSWNYLEKEISLLNSVSGNK